VDVEQVRSDFDLEAIARRFFSAVEQKQLDAAPAQEKPEAFFRCWTRKEAYIKATGDGLSLPLSQFDVSLATKEETNALLATRPDASEAGHWRLQEVPAGSGYVAALCVRGQDWKLTGWWEDRRTLSQ
jgi:4'-phosphopantetheinyl transferase